MTTIAEEPTWQIRLEQQVRGVSAKPTGRWDYTITPPGHLSWCGVHRPRLWSSQRKALLAALEDLNSHEDLPVGFRVLVVVR